MPCNFNRYEYYWCDGVNYKKPTKLPATKYIELLMDWVELQVNNEELFPQTAGNATLDYIFPAFQLAFCCSACYFMYFQITSDISVFFK